MRCDVKRIPLTPTLSQREKRIRKKGSKRTCKPGFVLGVHRARMPGANGQSFLYDDNCLPSGVRSSLCGSHHPAPVACIASNLAMCAAQQPTRKFCRTGPVRREGFPPRYFLFGLAPGGVCLARPVARSAGVLLPHRFTLADGTVGSRRFAVGGILTPPTADRLPPTAQPAVCFLLHFPGLATGGCYPPPCPVEPGLSSRGRSVWPDRRIECGRGLHREPFSLRRPSHLQPATT